MKTFKTPKGTELPVMDIKGKPYLQVAHRLVWFREEHPDWGIETEKLYADDTKAEFKAYIKDPTGRIINTGSKTETKTGFSDFYEKAETSAVGRALAMCGYGTQFAPDLDEGHRLADAPIETDKPPIPPAEPKMALGMTPIPKCKSGAEMVLTKERNAYRCKTFQNTWPLETKRKHDYIKKADLQQAQEAPRQEEMINLGTDPNEDVPF